MKTHSGNVKDLANLNSIIKQSSSTATPAQASRNCRTSHSPLPWVAGEVANEIRQPALSKRRRIVFPPDADGCNDRDFALRACNNVEKLTDELERCRDLLIAYKVAFPNHFSDLDDRFGADAVIKSAYKALQDAGVPNAQKGGQ